MLDGACLDDACFDGVSDLVGIGNRLNREPSVKKQVARSRLREAWLRNDADQVLGFDRHADAILDRALRVQERAALARGAYLPKDAANIFASYSSQISFKVEEVTTLIGGGDYKIKALTPTQLIYSSDGSKGVDSVQSSTTFALSFVFIAATIVGIICKDYGLNPLTYILPVFLSGLFLAVSLVLEWQIKADHIHK